MEDEIEINLNSKYAQTSINNTYIFDIGAILVPIQSHIHVKVKNCVFPHSFYNVNASNNYIIFIANGLTYTYIMDYGNYNAIDITKYFTSNIPNMSCTYSSKTNKFTFTHSLYEFTFSTNATCLEMFGSPSYRRTSTDKKLTSEYSINMSPIQSIIINTDYNTGNILSVDPKLKSSLCVIPVNSQPNSLMFYENFHPTVSNLYVNNLNNITLRITDQDNKAIEFNGRNWNITLILEIIDFVN